MNKKQWYVLGIMFIILAGLIHLSGSSWSITPSFTSELYTGEMIMLLIFMIYELASIILGVLAVTFFILGYLEKEDHKK